MTHQPTIKIDQINTNELNALIDARIGIGTTSDDTTIELPVEGEVLTYGGSPLTWRNLTASGGNIVGSDGINVTTGSPLVTIAVDSTVIRATGSPQSISGTLQFTQTLQGNNTAGSVFASNAPGYIINETDAAVDEKIWRFFASGGSLAFDLRNDAGSITNNWLAVTRTAAVVSSIDLTATEVTLRTTSADHIKINATGIGFFDTTPVARPNITGSREGNTALTNLLTALASLGLITDSTSA